MKVQLIRPKPHADTIGLQSIMICEPLELEYLAAAIKSKHQVEIIDMILEKKPLEHFIAGYRPEVVGITGYISHINVIREYAATIKKCNPEIKVIVGGVHAEVVPEDFYHRDIDFIVTGGGLAAFPELLDGIAAGRIAGHDGPVCVGSKTAEVPRLYPDRKITAKYRNKYYYVFHNPCALLKTSYGCPYSCEFCFCRQITADQYYEREIADVIEEIKTIQEREIYIVDDNFLFSPERVRYFCRLLQENRLQKQFLVYGRADFIAQNEDVIKIFKEVGLRAVIVGLETAKEAELVKYNKKSSIAVNEQAVEVLRRHRVDCYATLILGVDWDEKDFNHLYHWLKKNKLSYINLQPFTPLPGTPLFEEYQDRLIVPRSLYEQWDLANLVVQPSRISGAGYYYHILKLYCRLTLNPRSLGKNLKYGLLPNLKLALGVSRIARQYVVKMLKAGKR
ncbi:MAG: B12-binding domain-containing radical SAM protein [Peptococcaceae bacterium]